MGLANAVDDPVIPDKLDDAVVPDRVDSSKKTKFEQDNEMGQTGKELTGLATGIVSGGSGLPETMHPLSDAVRAAQKPDWMNIAAESVTPGWGIAKGLYQGGKEIFGGGEPGESKEDAAVRRAHGAGTIIGQSTGLIAGEGADESPVSTLAGKVKSGTGRALRTSDNALKPWVKAGSAVAGMGAGAMGGGHYGIGIEGTVGGGYLGPRIADAVIPNHPEAGMQGQSVPVRESPNAPRTKERLAAQVTAAKAAAAPPQGPKVAPWQGPMPDTSPAKGPDVKQWQGPLPEPPAKPGKPTVAPKPDPFAGGTSTAKPVGNAQLPPVPKTAPAPPPALAAKVKAPPSAKPAAPAANAPRLVRSPDEWRSHDLTQKILGKQASEQGMGYAAQGKQYGGPPVDAAAPVPAAPAPTAPAAPVAPGYAGPERRTGSAYDREIFEKMLNNPEGDKLSQSMKQAREGSEGMASEGPARLAIMRGPEYPKFRAAELAGDTATMREMLIKAKQGLVKGNGGPPR